MIDSLRTACGYRLPRGRFAAGRSAAADSFCAGARRISLFSFLSRSNSAIHWFERKAAEAVGIHGSI
jgi:hypothetical protein